MADEPSVIRKRAKAVLEAGGMLRSRSIEERVFRSKEGNQSASPEEPDLSAVS